MMEFESSGVPYGRLMDELTTVHLQDLKFSDGKVLGSMCTRPDDIAKEVYLLFIEANLGNPGLCPGTAKLEAKVMGMMFNLLGLDHSDPRNDHAGGQMVSGGTEANITALWLARNTTSKKEIVLPKSGHFSLLKAADLLGMKTRIIPLTDDYRMDVEIMKEQIGKETAAIIGVAGTTELGQVDPIEEIGEVALDAGIPFHVDAAFGGFVLPFLDDFSEIFDFRSPGVSSVGVDPHKMGMATIPSGALLLRDKRIQGTIGVDSPYLTSERNMSLSGTRNSASVAATYAVMRFLGKEGYRRIVQKCMRNSRYLAEQLDRLGLKPVMESVINVVAAQTGELGHKPSTIIKEMNDLGWKLSKACNPPSIRFVIMPHVTSAHIDDLIHDLSSVIDK